MLSEEELDLELRRLLMPAELTIKQVLDRIVEAPLPPRLAALVRKAMRARPGSALFKLGTNLNLGELQSEIDTVVRETFDPPAQQAFVSILESCALLAELEAMAQRDDLSGREKQRTAALMAYILEKIAPSLRLMPVIEKFFTRAAVCQSGSSELACHFQDAVFQIDLELTRLGALNMHDPLEEFLKRREREDGGELEETELPEDDGDEEPPEDADDTDD